MQDQHDLEILIDGPLPIIVVETHEERRVQSLFERTANRRPMPVYLWTVTEGLRRLADGFSPQVHTREPDEVLGQIKATKMPGIYVLFDFHPYTNDPMNIRYLKDIALGTNGTAHTIALVSHELKIPAEIERHCARFELSVPDRDRVKALVLEQAQFWSRANAGQNVKTSRANLDRLVENLLGLPERDVQRLARGAVEQDGAITESDLPEIMKAKFAMLGKGGVLSFEYDTARFGEVGGLEALKAWLEVRKGVFMGTVNRPGLDKPKGVMLLGVQGCGKSLAAKACAGAWGVPLLRLDFGSLYNKFHGETERNLRDSLRQAEVLEPCVLWVDEIEKGIASDSSDSGTSKRVLGTLLTWMAENESRVFIVATANDIEALPPELMRKGRLDEIFFVDLPDHDTRRLILEIHLRKRELDPSHFDVDQVTSACDGFSGAEIEQAVVSALYRAHAQEVECNTDLLLEETGRTRPLSVVMAEKIGYLRHWAKDRTVSAN